MITKRQAPYGDIVKRQAAIGKVIHLILYVPTLFQPDHLFNLAGPDFVCQLTADEVIKLLEVDNKAFLSIGGLPCRLKDPIGPPEQVEGGYEYKITVTEQYFL